MKKLHIFAIEPNTSLSKPYSFISNKHTLSTFSSVEHALHELSETKPDLVLISASFAVSKLLTLLKALKHASISGLIPLIFVIDLENKLSNVPGTTWGGKIGVQTSLSSKKEFNSTFNRVISS